MNFLLKLNIVLEVLKYNVLKFLIMHNVIHL
nr:MAG TPA: hypothetical protein [Caudoviricetes sp.]